MKHATPERLSRFESLLFDLRKIEGLKEKSRGVFYRSSRAFLHFHEHGDMLFADVRFVNDFERVPATRRRDQLVLLRKVRAALSEAKKNAK